MSILSDIADEAVKPIKTGIFITSAVVVTGAAVLAANSKTGRKFFKGVKDAIKSDDKHVDKDQKKIDEKRKVDVEKQVIEKPVVKETQGTNNA